MKNLKEININKIVDYIASGEKACSDKNIGIECEHFITDKNGEAVSFYGERGVESILYELSDFYQQKVFSEGHLVGLSDGILYITLEPSAQLEVSIIPFDDINKIKDIYFDFKDKVINILNKYGYSLLNSGYQIKSKVKDLDLIPKSRYRLMDKYFSEKGYNAAYMMRASASVQVNIDYSDELDFKNKYRLANLLSPLFYLITDNSAVFEGDVYNKNALRSYIWQNVDDSRCGIRNFCSYKEYAQWLYETEPIFISQNDDDIFCGNLKNCEIFRDKELTIEEIKHISSMVFPDIRVKQFIEIRPGDSMPPEFMFAYAALIKGIFYNSVAVESLNSMWENVNTSEIQDQILKIQDSGFNCKYLGVDIKELLQLLFNFSENYLDDSESLLLKPLKELSLKFNSPKHCCKAEVTI